MQRSRDYINQGLAGLALLLIISAIYGDLSRFFYGHHHYDFYYSYQAARSLIQGNDLYKVRDTFAYIYPPFYAFLLTPLAHLSETSAHLIWLTVNISLLSATLILGINIFASALELNLSFWQAAGACAMAVLLMQGQIHEELIQEQNDLLILFGFTLALFWVDRKPFLAGICLGLIGLIKYQGLFFLPFLLFRARWQAAAGLITGAVIAMFSPALMIGWNKNFAYLKIALLDITQMSGVTTSASEQIAKGPSIFWDGNVSISSGLARISQDHGWPVADAAMMTALIACLIFFYIWRQFYQADIPFIWRSLKQLTNPQKENIIISLEWYTILLCMLIFSPQCANRHLILLLNMNLFAAMMLLFPCSHLKRWPIILILIIIPVALVRLPFQSRILFTADHIGLPGWSYLVFLLVVIRYGLIYIQDGKRLNSVNKIAISEQSFS